MDERPIFMPVQDAPEFIKEISFNIVWNSGFASIQKKKNIAALHKAAAAAGYAPLLETSTKSEEKLGQHNKGRCRGHLFQRLCFPERRIREECRQDEGYAL